VELKPAPATSTCEIVTLELPAFVSVTFCVPVLDTFTLPKFKALELELIMKRASWQKLQARRGTWRTLSFLFLFLVILGALLAYYYFMTEVRQHGGEKSAADQVETGR